MMLPQGELFAADDLTILIDANREWARMQIEANHYAHSIPSGKSHYFAFRDALLIYSIPANPYIGLSLFGFNAVVWELSRLWAPDGHEKNLLTQAISATVRRMSQLVPGLDALVSYADPNVGHRGGVYRAASWIYMGQSDEGRYYQNGEGQVVARRAFHSGGNHLRKDDIIALGYVELKRPGKLRFVRPISKRAHKHLASCHSPAAR